MAPHTTVRIFLSASLALLLFGVASPHTAHAGGVITVPNGGFESGVSSWSAAPQNVVDYSNPAVFGQSPGGDLGDSGLSVSTGEEAIHQGGFIDPGIGTGFFRVTFQYNGPPAVFRVSLYNEGSSGPVTTIRQMTPTAEKGFETLSATVRYNPANMNPVFLQITAYSIAISPRRPKAFIDKVTVTSLTSRNPSLKVVDPLVLEGISPPQMDTGFAGLGRNGLGQPIPMPDPLKDKLVVEAKPSILVVSQDSLEENLSRIDIKVVRSDGSILTFDSEDDVNDANSELSVEILDSTSQDPRVSLFFVGGGVVSGSGKNSITDEPWPFDLGKEIYNQDELHIRALRAESMNVQLLVRYKRKVTDADGEEEDLELATVIPLSVRVDPNLPVSGYDVPVGGSPRTPPRDRIPDERLNRLFREKL